jgi:hypothetical protein
LFGTKNGVWGLGRGRMIKGLSKLNSFDAILRILDGRSFPICVVCGKVNKEDLLSKNVAHDSCWKRLTEQARAEYCEETWYIEERKHV